MRGQKEKGKGEEDLDEIVFGGIVAGRESDGGKGGPFLVVVVDVAFFVFFAAVAVVVGFRHFLAFLHLRLYSGVSLSDQSLRLSPTSSNGNRNRP